MKHGSTGRAVNVLLVAAALGLAASSCRSSQTARPPTEPPIAPPSSAKAPPASSPKPIADADRDGVPDAKDTCPNAPEDHLCVGDDGPPECCGALDGCPHPDPDGDGIESARDACPDVAEYWNDFQDDDGCPDGREIEDARVTSGAFNRSSEWRREIEQRWRKEPCEWPKEGAPPRVIIDESKVEILEKISFAPGTATIRAISGPILEAIAKTLIGRRQIMWVEVAAYLGKGGENAVELSRRRAEAVVDDLVRRGVGRERLWPAGYGAYCPLSDDPAKNERVEFKIVVTEEGVTNVGRGCEEASAHGLSPFQVGPRSAP